MKIWISRVTPQGLHYMESVTVRSRRKRHIDLDKALYTATCVALYVMTVVLCFAVAPMAWAVWQEVLR